MPILPPLLATLSCLAAAPPPVTPRIPPTSITHRQGPDGTLTTALDAIRKQARLEVEPPSGSPPPFALTLDQVPLWTALERIATSSGTRLVLRDRGQKVALTPRTGPPAPSSVDGPFRVTVRQVRAVTDFESGKTYTEITLDIHWEPRFPVFRLDSVPAIHTVTDDRGTTLSVSPTRARTHPLGSLFSTTLRIEGVPREAKKLTRLAGTFTVTASERMLPFVFRDLTKPPAPAPAQEGVTATLKRFEKSDGRWEAEIELTYPPGQPEFESFESWVTENRARLVAPDKARTLSPSDEDIPEQGRRVVAVYRFPGEALTSPAGWSLVYETPAPLIEFPVRFELKDIPLP